MVGYNFFNHLPLIGTPAMEHVIQGAKSFQFSIWNWVKDYLPQKEITY